MARGNFLHRPRTVEDTLVLSGGQERMVTDRDGYAADTWPGGIEPYATTLEPEPPRISAWAGLGLIVSVIGLCATLTGLLAPEGAAVGILGFLISVGGLITSGSPAVTGRGVAALGGLIALGAVVLAVFAMTGRYSWPNSRNRRDDQVPRLARWPLGLAGPLVVPPQ